MTPVVEWKEIKCLPIQMAQKGKGGKKRPRRDAQKKDTTRAALARKAGQDGVSPQLSKRKDSLFIQTPEGRLTLEAKILI